MFKKKCKLLAEVRALQAVHRDVVADCDLGPPVVSVKQELRARFAVREELKAILRECVCNSL